VHAVNKQCLKVFGFLHVKRKDHFKDLGINGRIILKLILGKHVWRVWVGFI
jgi:hypothetical protein